MTSNRAKRFIAFSLAAAFMFMALAPAFAQAAIIEGPKVGPYVEKLVFKVITADDLQVAALLDDEIDLIGDMVDTTFLD